MFSDSSICIFSQLHSNILRETGTLYNINTIIRRIVVPYNTIYGVCDTSATRAAGRPARIKQTVFTVIGKKGVWGASVYTHARAGGRQSISIVLRTRFLRSGGMKRSARTRCARTSRAAAAAVVAWRRWLVQTRSRVSFIHIHTLKSKQSHEAPRNENGGGYKYIYIYIHVYTLYT